MSRNEHNGEFGNSDQILPELTILVDLTTVKILDKISPNYQTCVNQLNT